MRRPVHNEEFLDLFRTMRRGAFRLELRDRYNVAAERERWEAFLAADWARLEELNRVQRAVWMQLMKDATTSGRQVERVRVVSEPPSRYIQFELTLNAGNAEAGEDIRYLPREQAATLDLPGEDYWLFDGAVAVVLRFDDDDVLTGMELTDEPATLARYRSGQQLAWQHAVPYPVYVKKWAGLGEHPPSA
ncbi:DUF6879 family protein [Thermoactinospora rubra]|uniref:DUF6879 family protein n=1 Tax=Thermoactinospora rubra TaxID=1088767 RepID=UPI00118164A3|nr:DUF6879 family protein [Thermoactinospora rubra]